MPRFMHILLGIHACAAFTTTTLQPRRHGAFSVMRKAAPRAARLMTMQQHVQMERTFIMVKPDGVDRGLTGEIIQRFERRGLHVVALRMRWASDEILKEHYHHIAYKSFFPRHLAYMKSAPVVAMVFEGKNAIAAGRSLLGATKPLEAAPGTIRGDFCIDIGRNLCHGSDSLEAARREISLWFSEEDLSSWFPTNLDQLVELPPDAPEEECMMYDPVTGACVVRETGDEDFDQKQIADQLKILLKKAEKYSDSAPAWVQTKSPSSSSSSKNKKN